jgi:flotillin
MTEIIIIIVVAVFVVFVTFLTLISRYKRCPSDKILVIYGRTGGTSAKCIHGGGAFIWPVVQDFQYLDLKPLSIDANLTNALSRQNIRVDVPCRFTIAISTESESMNTAAERQAVKKPPFSIKFFQFYYSTSQIKAF